MSVPKHILIVEDEPDAGELLKSILESRSFAVTFIIDSTKVISELKERSYDLFITDIMMPKLDGFALIDQIRKDEKLKDLRIIAVTAVHFDDEKLRFLNERKVTLVKKPFDHDYLLTKIG
jgi:DNA-binding response OmpR family regulator